MKPRRRTAYLISSSTYILILQTGIKTWMVSVSSLFHIPRVQRKTLMLGIRMIIFFLHYPRLIDMSSQNDVRLLYCSLPYLVHGEVILPRHTLVVRWWGLYSLILLVSLLAWICVGSTWDVSYLSLVYLTHVLLTSIYLELNFAVKWEYTPPSYGT